MGVETRDAVDSEEFKELVRQKFLSDNLEYTDRIAQVLEKDKGNFYKEKLEKYYNEIKQRRNLYKQPEAKPEDGFFKLLFSNKKEYHLPQLTAFVVGKNETEDSNESLSIKVYNKEENNSPFKIVDEIPVGEEDVSKETMDELKNIDSEIQLKTKEMALDSADATVI